MRMGFSFAPNRREVRRPKVRKLIRMRCCILFDGCIFFARSAPDPDQEIHRQQHDFPEDIEQEEIEFDAALTWSAGETLAGKDFEKMSGDEIKMATNAVKKMRLPISQVPTRRYRPDSSGSRVDMRRTLRAALRSGQGYIPLMRRERRLRRPPLVIICDISGSMERYSRMMLHFMHAVTNDRDRVHTFLFGTRLTNVTRFLRYKDIDMALAKVG